jgi:hypothetical protein
MKLRNTFVCFFIVLTISCASYKETIKQSGDKYDAIENIIKIYYHTNKKYSRKYNLFGIGDSTKLNQPYYYFTILPEENYYSIRKNDTIGSFPEYFPTNYIRYKNSLFVWNDKEKPLGMDVLNALDKIGKLDSIHLRYELGIYIDPSDTIEDWENTDWSKIKNENPSLPSFRIDERLEASIYIVCKNNIDKFEDITDKFWNEVALNCER